MPKFIISKGYLQVYTTVIEAVDEEAAMDIAQEEGVDLTWRDCSNGDHTGKGDVLYQHEGEA